MRYAQPLRGAQRGQPLCRNIGGVRRSCASGSSSLHSAARVPQALVRPLLRRAAWHHEARQIICSAAAADAEPSAVGANDSSG